MGLEHPEHGLVLANLSDRLKRGYAIFKHKEENRSLTDERMKWTGRDCEAVLIRLWDHSYSASLRRERVR